MGEGKYIINRKNNMDISKKEFQEKTRDQNIIIFGRKLKREKIQRNSGIRKIWIR